MIWSKRRWRWNCTCVWCGVKHQSDWCWGGSTGRPLNWSKKLTLCPECVVQCWHYALHRFVVVKCNCSLVQIWRSYKITISVLEILRTHPAVLAGLGFQSYHRSYQWWLTILSSFCWERLCIVFVSLVAQFSGSNWWSIHLSSIWRFHGRINRLTKACWIAQVY